MDSLHLNTKRPTVAILMSTYNGEKYLREQLDSIFAQEDVEIKLIVRDDGSSDETLSILKEYKGITVMAEKNIGCEESFKRLLYSTIEADYYAFADQDDVWHPRKLISAIENINNKNCDLVACNLMIADKDMNLEKPIFSPEEIKSMNRKFKNYIFGSCRGCTLVWTKRLNEIIHSYIPPVTLPHDYWVNTVATVVGKVYIDPECYINYRLHRDNTSGMTRNVFQEIRSGFSRYVLRKHLTSDVVCQLIINGFEKLIDVNGEKYKQLLIVSKYKNNIKSKIKLIFSELINACDFKRRCLYWICIIFNRF